MEYYSQNEKEISTSNLQNRLYLEEPDIMIPQNTTIITKEMKKQLEVGKAYSFTVELVKPQEKRVVLKMKK